MLTLACSFDSDVRELMSLRGLLRPYLESRGVPGDVCDDLALVVTELAANAIEAGPDRGAIGLRVSVERDAVIVEVEDAGSGFLLPPGDVLPSPHQERGRGLGLVRTLTSELLVERHDQLTVVRAVRRWGRAGGAGAAAGGARSFSSPRGVRASR